MGATATAAIITLKAMPTPVSRWMLGFPRWATIKPPTTAPPAMSEVSSANVPAPPWNVSWASKRKDHREVVGEKPHHEDEHERVSQVRGAPRVAHALA